MQYFILWQKLDFWIFIFYCFISYTSCWSLLQSRIDWIFWPLDSSHIFKFSLVWLKKVVLNSDLFITRISLWHCSLWLLECLLAICWNYIFVHCIGLLNLMFWHQDYCYCLVTTTTTLLYPHLNWETLNWLN